MQAVVIQTPGKITVGRVPDPAPAAGEVVVRVQACGICGTDLHIADGEFPPTPYPIVPGHEFAGEIAAVGAGVDYLVEGDRVAVDPSLFCGRCDFCRVGRGNLCADWAAVGDTVDGAAAEYVAVPAANCYRLPDHLSFAEGALVEPVACAVHGLRRLGPVAEDRALLVGAGTMGLLLLQLLRHGGAREVVVVDRNRARLEFAETLGATATATAVGDTDPDGFEVVVDATGSPAAIEAAFSSVRRGGRFLVFGVSPAEATVSLSPFRIYNDEITVIGSMAVLHSFRPALELVAAGAVRVAPLVTSRLPLERFPDALAGVRAGTGVKTHITPNG
ncbi:MAG: zinc-dependent alcohol dehydrogenase family protein [Frankia sp.]